MDSKTKGAWLLAQSKNLDAVTGAGAARLENIAYAGKIGRLYNLLRRNLPDDPNPTIPDSTVVKACQLNGIDRTSREAGLRVLKDAGRIDVGQNGEVSVLGISGMAVLELTAEIFDKCNPTRDEKAVLELSEKVAERPLARADAETFVSDTFEISSGDTKSLIDDCKSATLIDEEADKSRVILFNSNTFRDGQYAKKTYYLLQTLTAQDASLLSEVQNKLAANGALYDVEVQTFLGDELYRRLISVGFFDRMEISNSSAFLFRYFASSQQSNSWSMMLDRSGDRTPPCGTPSLAAKNRPRSTWPALRMRQSRPMNRRSLMRRRTHFSSSRWWTVSK
jgi:hypothetical protein